MPTVSESVGNFECDNYWPVLDRSATMWEWTQLEQLSVSKRQMMLG
jgi:hypothetical protein